MGSTALTFELPELMNRCLGDREFATELLNLFRNQLPNAIKRLEQLVQNGENVEAAKLTHSLKGTAANLAAKSLYDQMLAFERKLIAGKLQNLDQDLKLTLEIAQLTLACVPSLIEQINHGQYEL